MTILQPHLYNHPSVDHQSKPRPDPKRAETLIVKQRPHQIDEPEIELMRCKFKLKMLHKLRRRITSFHDLARSNDEEDVRHLMCNLLVDIQYLGELLNAKSEDRIKYHLNDSEISELQADWENLDEIVASQNIFLDKNQVQILKNLKQKVLAIPHLNMLKLELKDKIDRAHNHNHIKENTALRPGHTVVFSIKRQIGETRKRGTGRSSNLKRKTLSTSEFPSDKHTRRHQPLFSVFNKNLISEPCNRPQKVSSYGNFSVVRVDQSGHPVLLPTWINVEGKHYHLQAAAPVLAR